MSIEHDPHIPKNEEEAEKTPLTKWHEILGEELRLLLTPLNLTVHTSFDVMTASPEADILILRNETAQWTPQQRACLPDGIRDVDVPQVLIEFKFTESLTKQHLMKIQGYEAFYRQSQTLKTGQLQSFILSARTPNPAFRQQYGYEETEQAGVHRSHNPLLREIPLITLNDLADTPYNAFVKCFASRPTERRKAFAQLDELTLNDVSQTFLLFLLGLKNTMNIEREADTMTDVQITAEEVAGIGEKFTSALLRKLSPEDILANVDISQNFTNALLKKVPPEELLANVDISQNFANALLKKVPLEELLANVDISQNFANALLKKVPPEELLQLYGIKKLLAHLTIREFLDVHNVQDVLSYYNPDELLSHHEGINQYVTEQQKTLLIEAIQRTLRIRFQLNQTQLTAYQERLRPLDFAILEQLSETALLATDEAAFDQSLREIEQPN